MKEAINLAVLIIIIQKNSSSFSLCLEFVNLPIFIFNYKKNILVFNKDSN